MRTLCNSLATGVSFDQPSEGNRRMLSFFSRVIFCSATRSWSTERIIRVKMLHEMECGLPSQISCGPHVVRLHARHIDGEMPVFAR